MLNKDMLYVVAGGKKAGTHTVTVGSGKDGDINRVGFDLGVMNVYGAIVPSFFEGLYVRNFGTIPGTTKNETTVIEFGHTTSSNGQDGVLVDGATAIKVTRLDSGLEIVLSEAPNIYDSRLDHYRSSDQFFSDSDVGKDIVIMIEAI